MKQVNVLYIGNNLFEKTGYPSTLQTLSELLKNEGFVIRTTSSKLNVVVRMLDMVLNILKYQNTTDVVLIDTYSTLNFYYAFLCSSLLSFFNKPYIPILHGGNLPDRLKNSPNLSKSIFLNAHINVAPSMYLSDIFRNAGYDSICIPNTLKIEDYRFKKRSNLSPNLIFVRSFAKIYNPEMAVKVFFELKKEYPEAKLCMVGPDRDGTLDNVKNLVKIMRLESSVEFTGVLTKEVWHKKSEGYDIFINTSNVDNMPVSIIEAMALGIPVVSTNVGGIKYLINDKINGCLVCPNDEAAMLNAIKDLLENGPKNMAIKARTDVQEFRWELVKHKWNQILQNI